MGNKILKEYDMGKEQVGSGGIGCYWRLYDGVGKKNKEPVCIHILDKGKLPKKLRTETFYRWVRAEGATIARLKHPHILRVLHPLDESSDAFVLVTAPLLGSLSNVMRDYTNLEKIPALLADYSHRVTELETKNGLRQLSEALLFMHRDAKLYHRYVDPCNVYITKDGDWKLGGFYYSVQVAAKGERVKNGELFDWVRNPDAALALPAFKYLSPELADGALADHDDNADVFSLAKVAYHMNRFVSRNEEKDRGAIPDLASFQRHLRALPTMPLEGIPASLVEPLRKMLAIIPQSRVDLREFLNSGYFNDVMVRTLQFLTSLFEKDVPQRIEFLKRLPSAIPLFDQRTAVARVLPPLLMQLRDSNLSPFALPSMMMIVKGMESKEYQQTVMPALLAEFADGRPPPTIYVLLKNLQMLMSKSPADIQNHHIVPFVLRALECKQPQLVQLAITELVPCAKDHLFTYRTLKEQVLPRVKAQCCAPAGQPLPLRVNALLGLSQLFTLFDTDTVNDIILPTIDSTIEMERAPAVIMCCVGVWDSISKVLGADVSARRILPKLLPVTMEPTLNLQQFTSAMNIAREMIERITKSRSEQLQKKEAGNKEAIAEVAAVTNTASAATSGSGIEGKEMDPGHAGGASLQDLLKREYGSGIGEAVKPSPSTPLPSTAHIPAPAAAAAITPTTTSPTSSGSDSMFAGLDYENKDASSMLSFIQAGDPYVIAQGSVVPVNTATEQKTIATPRTSHISSVGDGYAAMSDDFVPRRAVMASASYSSPSTATSISPNSTTTTRPMAAAVPVASTPVIPQQQQQAQPFDLLASTPSTLLPYGSSSGMMAVTAPTPPTPTAVPHAHVRATSSYGMSGSVTTPMASSADMGLFGAHTSPTAPPTSSSSGGGSSFDFLNNHGHVAGAGPPMSGFDFMIAAPPPHAAAPSVAMSSPFATSNNNMYGNSGMGYGSGMGMGMNSGGGMHGVIPMMASPVAPLAPSSSTGAPGGLAFDMFSGMNAPHPSAAAAAMPSSSFDFMGNPSTATAGRPAQQPPSSSSGFSWMS